VVHGNLAFVAVYRCGRAETVINLTLTVIYTAVWRARTPHHQRLTGRDDRLPADNYKMRAGWRASNAAHGS
jgi:hypothetical protein